MSKKIALITSGGDAPGMNAAIRAVTLQAEKYQYQVLGFMGGYNGLIENHFIKLNCHLVDDIIRKGGTILKSARCQEMLSPNGPKQVVETLNANNIDALIVIGGDGSFKGCQAISAIWQGNIIGIPGTIDNDINGTDQTIGFWTAVETALDSIDKIRDTANAFERIFIVEVMGRNCGFLAVESAIGSGAEHIVCKEIIEDEVQFIDHLLVNINKAIKNHRTDSYIIVMAENSLSFSAHELSKKIERYTGVDSKAAILGYIQRGGSPVASDRVLATQLGVAAVDAVKANKTDIMVGMLNNSLNEIALSATSYSNTDNQSIIRRLNRLNFNLG
ncbi:ATP-dependent 6-phosphofructokinase [Pseudoalteromonas sp.]|uniref:ATP-dependent 6-phosphofructokinase n=1 Tax=Pseudoalteromonas sp. TaxID=53249 RepID=UPI00356B3210